MRNRFFRLLDSHEIIVVYMLCSNNRNIFSEISMIILYILIEVISLHTITK